MFKRTEIFISERSKNNILKAVSELEFRRNVAANRTPTVEEAFNQTKVAIESERKKSRCLR